MQLAAGFLVRGDDPAVGAAGGDATVCVPRAEQLAQHVRMGPEDAAVPVFGFQRGEQVRIITGGYPGSGRVIPADDFWQHCQFAEVSPDRHGYGPGFVGSAGVVDVPGWPRAAQCVVRDDHAGLLCQLALGGLRPVSPVRTCPPGSFQAIWSPGWTSSTCRTPAQQAVTRAWATRFSPHRPSWLRPRAMRVGGNGLSGRPSAEISKGMAAAARRLSQSMRAGSVSGSAHPSATSRVRTSG